MPFKPPFYPADILLPVTGYEKWSCVACDQYTSEPEYWNAARDFVGTSPSTLNIMLPELYLNAPDVESRIKAINTDMGVTRTASSPSIRLRNFSSSDTAEGGVRRGWFGMLISRNTIIRPTPSRLSALPRARCCPASRRA